MHALPNAHPQARRTLSPEGQGSGAGAPRAQPASVYRHRVGGIEVTALHDGHNPLTLTDRFIPGVTLDEIGRELEAVCLPADVLNIPFTPILVETAGQLVLIDTGYGSSGPPTAGMLQASLAAAGLAPGDVGKVILSHFHRDHICGLRDADGALAFPNAELLVPEVEWAYWSDPANRAAAPEAARGNFDAVAQIIGPEADRVQRFAWGDEPVAGITALDASGHTPGHTAFLLQDGAAQFLFLSDVTNHPALFLRNPGWSPAFDMDPAAARVTRRRLLGMAADQRLPCTGYHFPFPGVGQVRRDGARFRFHPAQWIGRPG